ncbi:MAG: IS200/IS605 family transposase [Pirellulaceae bacterium]|jgi:putative transposase|nr:IS200/IS605 family transposase [Pirellulaceae bacterium]
MKDWRSQSHVKWDCKYHVVIVPKYRRRKFYGSLRVEIGEVLRQLCRQKDIELIRGNALPDHVHLLLRVPPKYSIANTVGFLKGKSAIRINRDLGKTKGSLYGRAFWSRGYCVSTVGLDEEMIKEYIQNQEKHERDEDRGLFDLG